MLDKRAPTSLLESTIIPISEKRGTEESGFVHAYPNGKLCLTINKNHTREKSHSNE